MLFLQAKSEKRPIKMSQVDEFEEVNRIVEQTGVFVSRYVHGMKLANKDMFFTHICLSYCHQGSARGMYDMREMTYSKNDLAIVMPGHVLRMLDSTDDYVYTRVFISSELIDDLRAQAFSHDYGKFHHSPICTLTDVQAERLMHIVELLAIIAAHETNDLQYRRQMLLTQLSIGYEFLNYYRRDQDRQWATGRHAELYQRFCQLVVEHYKESREVQFYADLLHLTPKHFTKVIREETNGLSPAQWIEQYVVTQAKRLIETNPDRSIQEIAYMLGFSEPTTFHRYFKRVTGTTAKHFREK